MSHARHDPEFPRAVLHVDGDSFFVSCELTRRPDLRGRPCVTGAERWMATAVNHEAKKLGVVRGMRVTDIRRRWPEVVVLDSDYGLYRRMAARMYAAVRRFADDVEEYSIDECFADLTGLIGVPLDDSGRKFGSYEALAKAVKDELGRELGVTFSVGLGPNKVIAKAASKWDKPDGFTVIRKSEIRRFLAELPIGKVWGIGGSTSVRLRKLGIATALDLAVKDKPWADEHCDRPLREIWQEFQGDMAKEVRSGHGGGFSGSGSDNDFASVQRTGTFWPSTGDGGFLWSQISLHAEEACRKLREGGKLARVAGLMLKTSDFSYVRAEAELSEPTAAPGEVLRAIRPHFDSLHRQSIRYRATGVSLRELVSKDGMTGHLFGQPAQTAKLHAVHEAIDKLAEKLGDGAVFLASSFKARNKGKKSGRIIR